MSTSDLNSVFINCPFDSQYEEIFRAIVFTVSACGFKARCALEDDDAGTVRIDKIYRLIDQCNFTIHDISRTELDAESRLPRFNMPFELGVFFGAKKLGGRKHRNKRCLILDTQPYRYQQFLSDIASQDIRAHHHSPQKSIRPVRDWLNNAVPKSTPIRGADSIWKKYQVFLKELPLLQEELNLDDAFNFNDYATIVISWLRTNLD